MNDKVIFEHQDGFGGHDSSIYVFRLVNDESLFVYADESEFKVILESINDGDRFIEVFIVKDDGEHSKKCYVNVDRILYINKCVYAYDD